MTQNNQPPSIAIDKYIKEHVIDPLDTFRSKVTPFNDNQIDGVADFAKTIAGLLTGSDGQLAFQGPAADSLTDLISDYLDKEDKLTGATPGVLQGRLLDAAIVCEKYAKYIERENLGHTGTGGSLGNSAGYLYGVAASILGGMDEGNGQNEEGGTPQEMAQTELETESLSFETDMSIGPEQVSLQDLAQLPEIELNLPSPESPVNAPAGENPDLSTLGLTPEQEQLAEDLANESGQDLGTVRQKIKDNPGLTNQEYRDIIVYGLEDDPEVQSTGRTEVSQIREEKNLTSNRAMDRNIAVANYDINGDTGDLPAISGPEKPGFVEAPPPGSKTILTPTVNQGGYVADKDAEFKLLESLAEKYWSDDPAVRNSLTGEIHLYTERPPCDSCAQLIEQFEKLFPHIHIIVGWN